MVERHCNQIVVERQSFVVTNQSFIPSFVAYHCKIQRRGNDASDIDFIYPVLHNSNENQDLGGGDREWNRQRAALARRLQSTFN